ncbi:MAG: carbamoyl phosphate synthase small subunit, partial [Pseudanabaena sp. RU_4_16]|nr:carbamoyl phosphate synthase small subunit [Pseudanabaena sp. RU_4_16]
LEHKTLPIFSVQYHPEASPGPHDADYLFQRFVESMRVAKQTAMNA